MAADVSAIVSYQIDEALNSVDYSKEIHLIVLTDEKLSREFEVKFRENKIRIWGKALISLPSTVLDKICTALASRPFGRLLFYISPVDTGVVGRVLEAVSRNSSLRHVTAAVIGTYPTEGDCRRSLSSSLVHHLLLNPSCTLSSLAIVGWPHNPAEKDLLAEVLATNIASTLKSLELSIFTRTEDTQLSAIFRALEINTTLTAVVLGIFIPPAQQQLVYEAAIDLLSVNFTLTKLDLVCLDQDRRDAIESMLNENTEALAILNSFPRVQPTSARVFFCGNGYAGKTTLQKTMVSSLLDASFIRKVWATSFADSVGKGRQLRRTRGIEVTRVNHCDTDISFWDLAGQKEYHAFHDLMFPNEQGPSLFLIVCNICSEEQVTRNTNRPTKPLADVGAELRYWLRYISSNTRRSPRRTPHVSFIFTHIDMLGLNDTTDLFKDRIQDLIKELEQEFDSVIKVVGATFFVDGRKPSAVHGVAEHTVQEVKEITSNCQSVNDICNNAKKWIAKWMKHHPDQPWMKRNDLIRLCIREFYEPTWYSGVVRDRPRKEAATIAEAVLFDLHRTGNLIHFKDEDIVLVDVPWFCKDFMGSILEKTFQISADFSLASADNKLGVWRREDIKNILETACNTEAKPRRRNKSKIGFGKGSSSTAIKLDGEQLIRIMIQLEFCFEVNPGLDIFIPATLCSSNLQEHRRWSAEKEKPAYEFGYVGRRLECRDKNITFLTPGFFPRLQVHLRKVFESTLYYLEKDIIKIVDDRMEVLIEFNEAPTSFIDIMVRFSKPKRLDHVLDFINQRVIQNMRDLQRRSGCWQGVDLVEVALRPACVKKLIPPRVKQEQSVSLDRLRNIVLNNELVDGFENSTCMTWCSLQAASLGEEYTPIIELIGDGCFTGILSERLAKVEELSKQLGLSECVASSNNITSSMEASSKQRTESLQLDRMEAKIDAIAQDIKGVKSAIDRLLDGVIPEVQRLLTELGNHNPALGQGDNSELPRFFLLNKDKSIVYKLVPGLEKLRLNFLCESEPTPHLPVGQEGIEVTILEEGVLRSIQPYLHFLLSSLALMFRMGAPMFQAHGIMVPDCSDLLNTLVQKSQGVYERSDAFPETEYNAYGGGKHVGCDPVAVEKARIWVQSFMREKKCDTPAQISKRLGLMRKELMQGGCAWLCEDHYRLAV